MRDTRSRAWCAHLSAMQGGSLHERWCSVKTNVFCVYSVSCKMWKGYLGKGHCFPTTLLSSQTAGILVFYDSCIK